MDGDTINLFERGIIAGSPTLQIVAASVDSATVELVSFNGVCVTLRSLTGDEEADGLLIITIQNDIGVTEAQQLSITQGSVSDSDNCLDTRIKPTPVIEGGNRSVADTDSQPGELVSFNGSAIDDGIVSTSSFEWLVNGMPQSNGVGIANPTFFLADGPNQIELRVYDDDGGIGSTVVTVTVAAPGQTAQSPPNVTIAGGNRSIPDSDGESGEDVLLEGVATDADGTVATSSFTWFVNDVLIEPAMGQASPTIRLEDGENTVTLSVTDNDGLSASTTVTILVGEVTEAPGPSLEDNLTSRAVLTPNQRSVARAVDSLCSALGDRQQQVGLTSAQQDLLVRCSLIIDNDSSPQQQQQAVRSLSGEQVTTQGSTAVDFSRVNVSGLTSRLSALRQGVTGISLAGLSISKDGTPIPLDALIAGAKALLGGGASADEGDSLFGNKLGLFITGRYGSGDRRTSQNEIGFDFDSKALQIGVDYRFTNSLVLGAALSYGESDTDFYDRSGGLEGETLSGSLYGSAYGERLYVDFLASYGGVNFDSTRHIAYRDARGSVDLTALGSTNGYLATGGLSMGYNLGKGAWTFTPNVAITGTWMRTDGYAENGAVGLDLQFGEQKADSWDAQAGLMVGYVFSAKWGVLTPQIRGSYVHQEQDRGDVFVRFVNDPFSSAPQRDLETGFLIRTDDPDKRFFRWGASVSAVFKGGLSGFVDYQAFHGMRNVSYGEFSVGLRYELPMR